MIPKINNMARLCRQFGDRANRSQLLSLLFGIAACIFMISTTFACTGADSINNFDSRNELELIRDRYVSWTIGTGSLISSDPLVNEYHTNMLATFKSINDEYLADGGIETLEGIQFTELGAKNQEIARYVFDELLPALSMSYAYPGLVDAPNPHFKDPALLESITEILDRLYDAGWQSGIDGGFNFNTAKETGFVGFGGTIHNNISGYSKTIMLLRDELDAADRLDRELATLDWVTRIFAPDQSEEIASLMNFPGFNSDGFKSMVRNRLSYVASQLFDSPDRETDMRYLQGFFENAYGIAPGWADTIKPDGLGYHHKGFYGNTYSQQAFEAAARSAFLLHETSFALSEQSISNIKLALRAFRIYSQKYDIHRGAAGRFPTTLDPIVRLLPAYAYLGGEMGIGDPEVKAMFARLWDRDYFEQDSVLTRDFRRKGIGNVGELEIMLAAEAEGVAPEKDLAGHWFFPYGAMSIHRRNNWMAAIKGFSRYIWDYESSQTENLFGGNASSGVIRIYTRGDPVNAYDSGFGTDGWDWHRLPGATTVRIPYTQMKVSHRNFSDEAFAGGLSAENTNGIFAMRYENQVGGVPLKANKSAFFFDDQIILLGSNIRGGDSKHAIETTLFQTRLPERNTPTYLNGRKINGLMQSNTEQENAVWLTDSVGNGFYTPDGQSLNFHRAVQSAPDSSNEKVTSDLYATAWLYHGTEVTDEEYEYVVLVDAGAGTTAAFAENARNTYRVIQKDQYAHIVEHIGENIIGYAFFESGNRFQSEYIHSIDKPSLGMVRILDEETIVLSIANPDLALAPPEKDITFTDLQADAEWLYHHSETPNVVISIKGHWKPDSDAEVELLLLQESDQKLTVIEFPSKHSASRNVKLKKVT